MLQELHKIEKAVCLTLERIFHLENKLERIMSILGDLSAANAAVVVKLQADLAAAKAAAATAPTQAEIDAATAQIAADNAITNPPVSQ